MRCILSLLALSSTLLTLGCRTQSPTLTNPFLAPDRVPPPATRTLVPGTAQPYYPGDPVPNSPVVPQTAPVPTYAPPANQVAPPSGWNPNPQPIPTTSLNTYPSNGLQPVSAEIPTGPIVNVSEQPINIIADEQNLRFGPQQTVSPIIQQQAYQQPVVPQHAESQFSSDWSSPVPVQPQYTAGLNSTSTYPGQLVGYQEPAYQVPAAEVRPVQIRAIPPGTSYNEDGTPTSRDGFRPQGSSQSRTAIKPNISSQEIDPRFGNDPEFGWIRGQLEYSESTNQWKLRYIPIQQKTDQFGGSVLIANPNVLGGVRPGEHVQLRGQLHSRGNSDSAFSPIYTVAVVQRQQI